MIPTSKILWGEGLFLRPQHFQRQDAYHEWRAAEMARALHPYAWGVRRLKVDGEALASGTLRIEELSLIFADGELFNAPGEDDLPEPLNLSEQVAPGGELVVRAVIAPLRTHGGNAAMSDAADDGSQHYRRHQSTMADWYTQANEAEVSTLRRLVRLVPETDKDAPVAGLPLCRLKRQAAGGFELDARYVPPSVSLQAAPALQALVRRLLDILQAKVDALYGYHREPSKHVIEFRSGDIASFWLLHTASTACASLMHLRDHGGLHPERLFERLLELAGALMTFSKTHALSDLPSYDHAQPTPRFGQLEDVLRSLLETVISTRYFAIALEETKPSFHLGRLDSEALQPSTVFYLGLQAAMPATELVDGVPMRFKVGSPDDVDKLVLSALSGVRLVHAPQVPAAIPVKPGWFYFSLEPRGPLYERMLQAQAITVYAPAGVPELQMELYALNP